MRELLALLATQPGCRAAPDELAARLWPQHTARRRQQAFRRTVRQLQRCLDSGADGDSAPPFLFPVENGLQLAEACWVDVREFTEAIHRARLEPAPYRALDAYRAALSLYHGYYLADLLSANTWHEAERARLHRLYLEALEEAGLLCERCGRVDAALAAYHALIALAPYHSGARRHLARLEKPLGNVAAALRQAQWLSRALLAELNNVLAAPGEGAQRARGAQ